MVWFGNHKNAIIYGLKTQTYHTTVVFFLFFVRTIREVFSQKTFCKQVNSSRSFVSIHYRRSRRSQQTIGFKLPLDVVFACAKRDEPPSRRRPSRFSLVQNNILSTNSPERLPTSARHSVSSVFSVDYKKFV